MHVHRANVLMNFEPYDFNSDLREMLDYLLRLFDLICLLMYVRALLLLRLLRRLSLRLFTRRLLVLLRHGYTLLLAPLSVPGLHYVANELPFPLLLLEVFPETEGVLKSVLLALGPLGLLLLRVI